MTAMRHGVTALLTAASLGAAWLPALAAPPDGRMLYQAAAPFSTATRLPPAFAVCARCHGGSGEGGREGAMRVPPLTWTALSGPRDGLPRFADEAAVTRAIRQGDGRGGATLNAAMPRFDVTDDEAAALISYLRRIGTADDQPPGVTTDSIVLGTLLPLSGPSGPVGVAILGGLSDAFAAANQHGGIFGRALTLRSLDTASGAEQAAQDLLRQPVFAIVGGLWPRRETVERLLADRRVSLLAPLMPRDEASSAAAWSVEIMPSRTAQETALADAVLGCPASGARWALRLTHGQDRDRSTTIRWFDDAAQLKAALRNATKAGCLGIELAQLPAVRAEVPPSWQQRVVLPLPAALLHPDGRDPSPWRRLGRIAGDLMVELLARSGAQLHERSLIEAVARIGDAGPLHVATLQSRGGALQTWDADVVTIEAAQPFGGTALVPAGAQGN